MNPVDAYPLQWPAAWPRTKMRQRNSQFKMSDGAMIDHLYDELDRLGATQVVVSSNVQTRMDGRPLSKQRVLDDPGVAVYFKLKGHEQCIPCDKWDRPTDNLHAVGLAIQAIRGFERWGTGQMVDAAFRGFTALPPGGDVASPIYAPRSQEWHEVLEVSKGASKETIKAVFLSKASRAHPDKGGSTEEFIRLQKAYEEGMAA